MVRTQSDTLNRKQELFAQNIANGMTQKDAYLKAGYTNTSDKIASVRGHQMTKQPNIAKRIDELTAERITLNQGLQEARSNAIASEFNADDITLTWFRLEMYENLRQARELGKIGDANNALIAIAKTKGWFKEFEKPGRPPNNAQPTTPEQRENAQSRPAINLQVINNIVDKALDAGGGQHSSRTTITASSSPVSGPDLLDSKSGDPVFSFDGTSGEFAAGLLEALGEDGSE